MKILFYEWNAYNLMDTRQAFEQEGHRVSMLSTPLKNPEEDADYTHMLARRLTRERYDFVFSINYFPVLSEACHQTDTHYVCWNCDGSLLGMYHESIFYPTNVIFTFDYSNYACFRNLGVKNIFHLPLTAPVEKRKRQLADISVEKYPISFVGNLYEKNSYDDIADRLPEYLQGYLEGVIEAQCHVSGGNIILPLLTEDICQKLEAILNYHKSAQSFATVKELFASTVLGFKSASLQRTRYLQSLSEAAREDASVEVHLFTNSPGTDLPLVKVHGAIDYHTVMPVIFRQSRINLNMTIPTIPTGIPLRVWDVLSCGGFLLSNYQPEFDNYFKPGVHMDIFEDTGELLEKTRFYLKHEEIRKKIARQGFELVERHHDYTARIREFFTCLESCIS